MRLNDNWWLGIFTGAAVIVCVVGGLAVQRQRADAAALAESQKRALAAKAVAKRLASNEATTTRVVSVVTTTVAGDDTTATTKTTTSTSSTSTTNKTTKKTVKRSSSTTTTVAVARAAAVGDDVELGTYNGSTLTWRILSLDNKRIVLLSDRVLVAGPYQSDESASAMNDYAISSVRSWLNDTFVPGVFGDDADNKAMLGRSSASDVVAGDIAYLLTPSELCRYLPEADDRVASSNDWAQRNVGYGGATLAQGPAYWWLAADPDTDATDVVPVVQVNGAVNVHRYAGIATDGVRPCIRLVPSAVTLKPVAGSTGVYTVSAK